jgi:hypothetical protein
MHSPDLCRYFQITAILTLTVTKGHMIGVGAGARNGAESFFDAGTTPTLCSSSSGSGFDLFLSQYSEQLKILYNVLFFQDIGHRIGVRAGA